MQKIELRPAYEWTCEECGRSQFETATMRDIPQEDRLEFAIQNNVLDDDATELPENMTGEGMFAGYPIVVVCNACGAEFESSLMEVYYDTGEDENEDDFDDDGFGAVADEYLDGLYDDDDLDFDDDTDDEDYKL